MTDAMDAIRAALAHADAEFQRSGGEIITAETRLIYRALIELDDLIKLMSRL